MTNTAEQYEKLLEERHELLEYISLLEDFLDEGDENDLYGTEGWRHCLGIEE